MADTNTDLIRELIAARGLQAPTIAEQRASTKQAFPPELLPQAAERVARIGAWLIGHTSP